MQTTKHRLRRGLALAIAVGAIAAPGASAAPIDPALPTTTEPREAPYAGAGSVSSPSPAPQQVTVTDDGFDWGDAGIGATGMLALAAIAAGGALALGRRPSRTHSAA